MDSDRIPSKSLVSIDNETDSLKDNSLEQSNNATMGTPQPPGVGKVDTSYATLSPYAPNIRSRGRGGHRGRNNLRKPHQAYKEQQIIPNLLAPDFKKFYVMKPMNDINLWKSVDTIAANKELVKYIKGIPRKVSELKNGSLLIEVATKDQANKIKQIKRLNNVNVTVIPHSTLNYTKGTIRCKRFIDIPEETLIEEMKEENVIDIYKVKRKEQNELVSTGTMILTFDRCTLPTHINIGWKRYEVREYVPLPRRCYKCQGFNHSSRVCHASEAICVNCGEPQHGKECHSPPHCFNCDEAHPASDKSCFYYKLEIEILSTKTKEKLSYGEAKRNVLKRFVKPAVSYAQAAKINNSPTINENRKPVLRPTNTHIMTNHLSSGNHANNRIEQNIDRQSLLETVANQTSNNEPSKNETIKTTIDISRNATVKMSTDESNNRKRNIQETNSKNKVAKVSQVQQSISPQQGADRTSSGSKPQAGGGIPPAHSVGGAPLRHAGGGCALPQHGSGGGAPLLRAVGGSPPRRVVEGTGGGRPPQAAGTAPVAQVLHQSVVQHQQQIPTLSRDTAAAINRDDPQKMETEMAIDTLISPSPIITTNRGNRHRSSSRDSRHTSRERKA